MKRKSRSQTSSASVPERIVPPTLPRLRALQNEAEETPVSESSVASSVSPRSGPVVEVMPIRRINSSPEILDKPIQVMSPNLVAGSASLATPAPREQEFDQTVARAVLQQRSEVKTDGGNIEKTFTQCAKNGLLQIKPPSKVSKQRFRS